MELRISISNFSSIFPFSINWLRLCWLLWDWILILGTLIFFFLSCFFQIMRDPETGNSRGFGFISYDSFETSDAAIEVLLSDCESKIVIVIANLLGPWTWARKSVCEVSWRCLIIALLIFHFASIYTKCSLSLLLENCMIFMLYMWMHLLNFYYRRSKSLYPSIYK